MKRILWYLLLLSLNVHSSFMYVDFDQSMAVHPNDLIGEVPKHIQCLSPLMANRELITQRMNLFKAIFEKNGKRAAANSSQACLIPKIIHQIWFGPKPLPKYFRFCMDSCKKRNPEWKYSLWTETEVAAENFKYKNFYLDPKINPAKRSDVLRFELLQKYGGTYLDVDFYCCKNLESLNQSFDFYCTIATELFDLNNAAMAAAPGHPLIELCLDTLRIDRNNTPLGIMRNTGPYFLTQSVLKYLEKNSENNIALLPRSYLHPMGGGQGSDYWDEKNNLAYARGYAMAETFAIHLSACSWLPNNDKRVSLLNTLLAQNNLIFTIDEDVDQLMNARRPEDLATPVIIAAQKNLIRIVDILGRHRVDFMAQDKFGHDALYYAEQMHGQDSDMAKLIRAYIF